jgi:hypothetical protein
VDGEAAHFPHLAVRKLRELVGHQQRAAVDAQVDVHQAPAILSRVAHHFLGGEGLLVELRGLRGAPVLGVQVAGDPAGRLGLVDHGLAPDLST